MFDGPLARRGQTDAGRPEHGGRVTVEVEVRMADQRELVPSTQRKVTIVRRNDCSHGQAAVAAVRALASKLGIGVSIEQVIVATAEEAAAARCIGSPTVLIQGQDVEPDARGTTCFGVT